MGVGRPKDVGIVGEEGVECEDFEESVKGCFCGWLEHVGLEFLL